MKARLLDDSLRLRLSRSEVAEVAAGESVINRTRFPGGTSLQFVLGHHAASQWQARIANNVVHIDAPSQSLVQWARGDDVSINAVLAVASDASLTILVEKDFACLTARAGDEDCFPHPADDH
ncbi:MAG: hypothetical protein AAF290_03620 [Pseudomonadota bacterium]